jgi:peptidoglycan/LPS O-acetylase OafA/YrhL
LATQSAALTATKTPGRIKELDGLRGIAVLLVVCWHYVPRHFFRYLFPLRIGWVGVDLFFVLSGFLIGGILLDNRGSESYFKTFYWRRAHRILPLYYAWMGIVVLLRLPTQVSKWYFVFFLQNNVEARLPTWESGWVGHMWSLAIEEQFYLLAPLAIRFLPLRVLPWFLGLIVAGAPVVRWMMPAAWPLAPYLLTPCRSDTLAIGVLAAKAVRHPPFLRWLAGNRATAAAITALAGLPVLYLARHATIGPYSIFDVNPCWYSAIAIFFGMVISVSAAAPPLLLSKALFSGVLQRAGHLSYAIYVLHQPVLTAVQQQGWRPAISAPLACVVTFVLAELSGRFLERPLMRRGHRLYRY